MGLAIPKELNHNLEVRGNMIVVRFMRNGRQHKLTTGQRAKDGEDAWRKARGIRNQLMGLPPETVPTEDKVLTVGELIELFLESRSHVDTRSTHDAINAFRRILRLYTGLDNVDHLPVTAINEAAYYYQQHATIKPVSINSDIGHARCIFSRRATSLYHLRGFRSMGVEFFKSLAPLKASHASEVIPVSLMQQIDEAAVMLEGNLLLGYHLIRHCSLRNKEAYMLRCDDIHRHGDVYWIQPSHTKTGQPRSIPICEDHYRMFKHDREYVLEGSRWTRESSINRDLSQWLRNYIPMSYSKSVYNLRKHCERELRELHGNVVASKLAGHSTEVSYRHYDHIGPLPTPLVTNLQ